MDQSEKRQRPLEEAILMRTNTISIMQHLTTLLDEYVHTVIKATFEKDAQAGCEKRAAEALNTFIRELNAHIDSRVQQAIGGQIR